LTSTPPTVPLAAVVSLLVVEAALINETARRVAVRFGGRTRVVVAYVRVARGQGVRAAGTGALPVIPGVATFGRDGAVLNVMNSEALVAVGAGVGGGPVVTEDWGWKEKEDGGEEVEEFEEGGGHGSKQWLTCK